MPIFAPSLALLCPSVETIYIINIINPKTDLL